MKKRKKRKTIRKSRRNKRAKKVAAPTSAILMMNGRQKNRAVLLMEKLKKISLLFRVLLLRNVLLKYHVMGPTCLSRSIHIMTRAQRPRCWCLQLLRWGVLILRYFFLLCLHMSEPSLELPLFIMLESLLHFKWANWSRHLCLLCGLTGEPSKRFIYLIFFRLLKNLGYTYLRC